MSEEAKCEFCDAEIPKGAPFGICPQCLVARGVSADLGASAKNPSPAEKKTPFEILDRDELARDLPGYEILELIGQGGMGVVYKARQPQLDRLVAIKILPAELDTVPGFAKRFQREAHAMARLQHTRIVSVYNFGETPGGYLYIVMEYVEGTTLQEVIRAKRLDQRQILAVITQVCDALQYAHDHGILHRDIKPSNIMLDVEGKVKVADFGLAKLTGDRAETVLTKTDVGVGTPLYAAPEQLTEAARVDHRADIYSLGVLLYEMLTGMIPHGAYRPPSARVEDLDSRLDEVVTKAMREDPDSRYQNVSDIWRDVERIVTTPDGPLQRAPVRPAVLPVNESPSTSAHQRRFAAWFIAGIAVVGLSIYLANPLFSPKSSAPSRPEAEPPPVAEDAAITETASPGPALSNRAPGTLIAWHCGDLTPDLPGVPPFPGGLESVVAIDTGHNSNPVVLILKDDGTVAVWGVNKRRRFDPPEELSQVSAIAMGHNHCLALKTNGTVVAWGDNSKGECDVPEDLSDVIAIDTGNRRGMALKRDGTVVQWGGKAGGFRQAAPKLEDVVAIAAGHFHFLALTRRGRVIAWGVNNNGETDVPEGLEDVVAIATRAHQSFALTAEGKLVRWGKKGYGHVPESLENVTDVFADPRSLVVRFRDGEWRAYGEGIDASRFEAAAKRCRVVASSGELFFGILGSHDSEPADEITAARKVPPKKAILWQRSNR